MTEALIARGMAEPVANLAAEMGVLAFKQGYAAWSDGEDKTGFASYVLAALDALREAISAL